MSFITIPEGPLVKGNIYEISINKAELLNNAVVANDTYFNNSNRWNNFSLEYESPVTGHKDVVFFNAELPSPVGKFKVSEYLRGSLRVVKFTIFDFDNGKLTLSRNDLNIPDFNLNMRTFIAPSQTIISKNSETVLNVTDGSNYKAGYKVILFNVNNNTFEDRNEIREITQVIGNEITINSSFTPTIETNNHKLRFPDIDKCNYEQQSTYYFNTKRF